MKFVSLLDNYTADVFRGSEAEQAIAAFKQRIPGRILQMEFDHTKSNKQGVKVGSAVYKLGLDISAHRVFIEYLDDPNQAQPTMTLYVDKAMPAVLVKGWQVDRQMQIVFTVADGSVKKSVKLF